LKCLQQLRWLAVAAAAVSMTAATAQHRYSSGVLWQARHTPYSMPALQHVCPTACPRCSMSALQHACATACLPCSMPALQHLCPTACPRCSMSAPAALKRSASASTLRACSTANAGSSKVGLSGSHAACAALLQSHTALAYDRHGQVAMVPTYIYTV
jgi:hypothetical protein